MDTSSPDRRTADLRIDRQTGLRHTLFDDIGMLPAGQDAAEAFYRVVDAAYEGRSMTVTSNLHPR